MTQDRILVRGAREHNLKNVDVEIPRDKMVVITGLSGSGKSSLAFDTIYAEGQRRYVESLSAYARQFLGQMDKPDVDDITGLSPAVSIDQKSTTRNPRSTVGTVTEIYDYLRLMFARIGRPHCPQCGREIAQQTVEQIVDQVMALPEGSKIQVLAPIVRGRKGEYRQVIEDIRKQGFVRVRVDGQLYEVTDDIEMDRYKQHTIEVVVDRLIVKPEIEKRLADSLETALKLANGNVGIDVVESTKEGERAEEAEGEDPQSKIQNPKSKIEEELFFSENFACTECGISLDEIAPRNFSFNSPYGACPDCHGLGTHSRLDPDLIIPDRSKSIDEGAVLPLARTSSEYHLSMVEGLAKKYKFKTSTPIKDLTERQFDVLLNGADQRVPVYFKNRYGRMRQFDAWWDGIVNWLDRRYKETSSDMVKEEIGRYMSAVPCGSCKGMRLRPESLAVTIASLNISEVAAKSVSAALEWFEGLRLTPREEVIAHQVVKEIKVRLGFLQNVGLEYLTLDRAAATLAGGEAQRIRLASQIGSGLMGVLYILDEPSIGLHQRDNTRLIETLHRLRDLGNTIIVVEHDEETMQAADHIIDIGPGAGEHGGWIVAEGTMDDIRANPRSITGKYLSGELSIPVPERRRPENSAHVELRGAREHNLKGIDVDIPLGTFVCVTGVSGSGKSTLIQETLFPRLMYAIHGTHRAWGAHDEIIGADNIDKVIDIDQSPIGRTPRSNPATYTGTFDLIRSLFAQTPEARMRGYQPGRFSFNVKGGRCEACKGDGIIKIEMHFLPDVYVPCEVCKGKRYNRETLEVKYKGKSIADVLDMTVSQALEFFKHIPPIMRKLQTIHDVGLDYIKLGQPATTLSGGEAQRVKLSTELAKRSTGRTMYILDEPTTGLHFHDIKKLLEVLGRLVDTGNTVLVIEHNLDVIKTADYIIDLGPEGGDAGGEVVATGTPEEVARVESSHTGRFLRKILGSREQRATSGEPAKDDKKGKKKELVQSVA
ncbi:MAG: excinuclease ABC subunit UvrA [Armatimonadetes bacterium]|nr:excinuclease ABC subunit UvrA [Armatimonadota bacterium]